MKEKIFGIFILVFFYGIYFTKMWLQKQKGIRTHQIGSRKEKGLHLVETLMSNCNVDYCSHPADFYI